MSAAYPDIKPQFSSVSPLLVEAVNDNLAYFTKVNKTVLEMIQEVASVHEKAASSILSMVDTFKKKINDCAKAKPQCQSESYEKFIHRLFEQLESQAKVLCAVSGNLNECVVAPVRDVIEKKKDIWKTCSFYVGSFQQQIKQKEDDLVKRFKDCCDANKASFDGKGSNKQQLIYHNSHNTYLLRLSSVNTINKLLYTHVLPYVLQSIEKNQAEINDSLRHHVKYMFRIQKETLKKLIKSVDKIDHATDKIDLVGDLHKFVKMTKGQVKDKSPPQHGFVSPNSIQGKRASVIDTLDQKFIVNQYTKPNLQRRLAALQNQTSELVNNIAALRDCDKNAELDVSRSSDDLALKELIEILSICDKEANLNVLLKQMELYTPDITEFLNQISKDFQERKHSKMSQRKERTCSQSEIPHEFAELRSMKPLHCFYCNKLLTTFGKGYVCKSCKMPVHKKCATNVPFCEGINVRAVSNSTKSYFSSTTSLGDKPKAECAEVNDLIDLESDDDYGYFDDDEFDDGLSDEEAYELLEPQPPRGLNPDTSPALRVNPPTVLLDLDPKHTISKKNREIPPPLPRKPSVEGSPFKPVSSKSKAVLKPVLPAKSTAPKPTVATKPTAATKPVLAAKPSLSSSSNSCKKKCVAWYDYNSSEPSELTFISGSIIEIVAKDSENWWKGMFNSFEGYFPRTYVKEISSKDLILRALYPFTAQTSKELTVAEGQILVLVKDEDDWKRVLSADSEGLVPTSYVEYL